MNIVGTHFEVSIKYPDTIIPLKNFILDKLKKLSSGIQ